MNAADPARLRRLCYTLLITVAVAAVCGRILAVLNVYEPYLYAQDPGRTAAGALLPLGAATTPEAAVLLAVGQSRWHKADANYRPRVWPADPPESMPTFGSNDRSRWDTIRALVDHGTYAIGYRDFDPDTGQYRDRGIVTEEGWQTSDKVLHPELHGHTQWFLSSKPPLFPTLVAGQYWLLQRWFGWSIAGQRMLVIRTGLLTWNALPFLIYLVLLSRLVERWGTTDWGRLYIVAAACFGTFLTTFAVTLNNHSVAACSALFALYPALAVWESGRVGVWESGRVREWERKSADTGGHVLAGSQALAPSRSHSLTLPLSYALAGFFAGFTACCELPAAAFAVALFVILLMHRPWLTLACFLPALAVPVAAFFVTNYLAIGQFGPAYGEFGGPWYEYAGSPWIKKSPLEDNRGIDWAGLRESKPTYAFHFLLGHHGVFSLSPIWLLAAAGMVVAALALARRWKRQAPAAESPGLGRLVAFVRSVPAWALVGSLSLLLTLVLLGFYFIRTSNYGGWTSGPRWLFWLTPFWLLSMVPIADWLAARRWGRVLGYIFLAISVLSVSYPAWNPWRHPWLYNWLDAQGWIPY
jgi:hypothetical protein